MQPTSPLQATHRKAKRQPIYSGSLFTQKANVNDYTVIFESELFIAENAPCISPEANFDDIYVLKYNQIAVENFSV
jgi:hypothetical protein